MFVYVRVPETVRATVAPILEKELANEAAFGAKLENWPLQRRSVSRWALVIPTDVKKSETT